MSGSFSLLRAFTPTAEYPARRADAAGDLFPDAQLAPRSVYAVSVKANLLPLSYHSATVVAITCGGGTMNWVDYTFVDYSDTIPLYFTTGAQEGQFDCVFAFQQRLAGQQDARYTAASIPPNFTFKISSAPTPPPPSPTPSASASASSSVLAAIIVPLVLVCALVGFLWCRRRRQANKRRVGAQEQPGPRAEGLRAPRDLAAHAYAIPVAWVSAAGSEPVYVATAVPLAYAYPAAPAPAVPLANAEHGHSTNCGSGHSDGGSGEEGVRQFGDASCLDPDASPPYSEHEHEATSLLSRTRPAQR